MKTLELEQDAMAGLSASDGSVSWVRTWAMANGETFTVKPIGAMVKRYLAKSKVSCDPFARNKRWATHTNDLNPATEAEHHMDSIAFLEMLVAKGTMADLVIFDPPYPKRRPTRVAVWPDDYKTMKPLHRRSVKKGGAS